MLRGRPIFVLRSELGSQRKGDQEKNDEPAGVNVYRDAENTSYAKTCGGQNRGPLAAAGRTLIPDGNRSMVRVRVTVPLSRF